MKLIKLNANFSNFIFIVNLDSEQVAKAIKHRYGDEVLDGKLFLEKIINIPIHLPRIEEEDLKEFFRKRLFQIKTNLGLKNSEKIEEELKAILPEAFAVIKETARRWSENGQLTVTAQDFDKEFEFPDEK